MYVIRSQTPSVYALDDNQLVEMRPGKLRITTLEGKRVVPRRRAVHCEVDVAEKGCFPDFMLKEMHEQPAVVRTALAGRVVQGHARLEQLNLTDDELRRFTNVVIVGCGTSYHAGISAKRAVERWVRLPVHVETASEFRYGDPILDSSSLVVAISQSGETLDVMEAAAFAKRRGAPVLAVVNVVDSSLARDADAVLYTHAGLEIGVAATKTHVAQLIVLKLLALYLAQVRGTLDAGQLTALAQAFEGLPAKVDQALHLHNRVSSIADAFSEAQRFIYIGRGSGVPVALEGALKLKEIGYVDAEAYAAGELKHGPIALVQPGTVVIALATRSRVREKVLSNVHEVRARGASVLLIVTEGDDVNRDLCDAVVAVPYPGDELLAPVVDVVPLQSFAYAFAKARGNDVDRPRNLAKTVTVE